MQSVLSKVLFILEIIILVAAFALNYFTKSRMGMMRHVTYKNLWFEKSLFNETGNTILLVLIAGAIILSIITTLNAVKTKRISKVLCGIITGLILLGAGAFTLLFSKQNLLAYYYILLCIGIYTILDMLRNLTGLYFGKPDNKSQAETK